VYSIDARYNSTGTVLFSLAADPVFVSAASLQQLYILLLTQQLLPLSLLLLSLLLQLQAWSAYAVDTALYACQRGHLPDRAVALLDRLRSAGVQPTLSMHNRVACALEAASRHSAVLAALEAARTTDGLAWDVEAYAAAVRACSALKQPRRAVALVGEAEAAGVVPSAVTYAAAIAAAGQQVCCCCQCQC
jgi:hypothetical protein